MELSRYFFAYKKLIKRSSCFLTVQISLLWKFLMPIVQLILQVLDDFDIPEELRDMFISIPVEKFRMDISSTEIRKKLGMWMSQLFLGQKEDKGKIKKASGFWFTNVCFWKGQGGGKIKDNNCDFWMEGGFCYLRIDLDKQNSHLSWNKIHVTIPNILLVQCTMFTKMRVNIFLVILFAQA